MTRPSRLSFYEFFAGGGMARLGLGEAWRCLFANDFDPAKAQAYAANFGDEDLHVGDVWDLQAGAPPGQADLAWASSPCQDLSLAGKRGGLSARRSGAFHGFWRQIEALRAEGRAPRLIVLENVVGLASSNRGADFQALCRTFASGGYHFGALEIDAARFLPQSRPRLFVIAVRDDLTGSAPRTAGSATSPFHTSAVRKAAAGLAPELAQRWIWFDLPEPPLRNTALIDMIEDEPASASWHTPTQTRRLTGLMNARNLAKLQSARTAGETRIGAVYRRTRSEQGERVQRAEVRFDGLAGCLRTPGGGSSKQFLLFVTGEEIRSRPMTAPESARLMGLPDDYHLPRSANQALYLTGDGVAVPVVRWLATHILEPLLKAKHIGAAA